MSGRGSTGRPPDTALVARAPAEGSCTDGSAVAATALPTEPVLQDARQYLSYYWPDELDSEDVFILQFLHDVYAIEEVAQHAAAGSLVEVGGGPVIDKLLSASAHSRRIFHLEPSPSARREVELWKMASPQL